MKLHKIPAKYTQPIEIKIVSKLFQTASRPKLRPLPIWTIRFSKKIEESGEITTCKPVSVAIDTLANKTEE